MRTEQPTECFVALQKLRAMLAPLNLFKPHPLSNSLLTVPRDSFVVVLCCLVLVSEFR